MSMQAVKGQAVWLPRLWRVPGAAPVTPRLLALDLCERAVIAAVWVYFAERALTSWHLTANVFTLLLLLAETLPLVFMLIRPPSATLSRKPLDWALAILGTITPLMVTPAAADAIAPIALCYALMLGGVFTQVAAKLVLGRSFGIVAANRGVKVVGPYRLVRHPMYAGYTMTHVGFLLAMPSLSTALLYALELALQVARIYREERVLRMDADYRDFAARVRYRLLPGVF